jgi:hypothetical protein
MSLDNDQRASMETILRSLNVAIVKMDQMAVDGMGKTGHSATEISPAVEAVVSRPNVIDKAMRARVALSDAIHATKEAFAATGIRPS